ncbi:hypothetical protein AK812_SmicGene41107 [Symbiodinium microadriaticum]|uniref:Uncharacterized protein n=1 Tax=Symbiodinium microadriaticum TaxID=2951 RepID=A0A1Q9C719_SYMMI|nr:hypothetical protein AK812_SmicGene41107 [Symbiodinium microadriaticum]
MLSDNGELEHFIEENNIDEKAAALLREAPGSIQRAVLEGGSLRTCRDPSAGCVGRIRKAEKLRRGAPHEASVEDFISANWLSGKAAAALRSVPSPVQRKVLEQGSLRSCRDPNGGCLSRINRAQAATKAPATAASFASPTRDEIEFFVEDNGLNERAAEALRGAPPAVQHHVLEQGSLRSCREPSAGCIGRIGKAQKQMDPALLAVRHGPSLDEVEDFIADNRLDERAAQALRGAASWVQRQVLDQGSLSTCRDPNAGCIGRLHRAQMSAQADEVESFIQDNSLNARAASLLRSSAPSVQRKVLDQGSLYGTREPSAACVGRIGKLQRMPSRREPRRAREKRGAPNYDEDEEVPLDSEFPDEAVSSQWKEFEVWDEPAPATETLPEMVEQFILDNELNNRAASALRGTAAEVQRQVMEQGSLATCREPSAGCIGRIRKAEAALHLPLMEEAQRTPPPQAPERPIEAEPTADELDAFIWENQLNERAADALRGVSSDIQMDVLSQGSLASCREPSAGCIGRIAKAQAKNQYHGSPAASRHPNGESGVHQPRRRSLPSQPWMPSEAQVEQFVEDNELNERAADALRSIPAIIQKQVLEQGSLRGCREPSAGCIGRIAKAQRSAHVAEDALQAPSADELSAFAEQNSIGDRATSVLYEAPAAVQRAVLDQGSLQGCRDPGAGCVGRIRKAQEALRSGSQHAGVSHKRRRQEQVRSGGPDFHQNGGRGWVDPKLRSAVENFVREFELSERAANTLRQEPPEVQEAVLRGGNMNGARDTSACCMGRIRKAHQEFDAEERQPAKRRRHSSGPFSQDFTEASGRRQRAGGWSPSRRR